jgi:hypothetical protein
VLIWAKVRPAGFLGSHLNVEPAVAIAAATKPIAIVRIMMLTPFVLSTPAFRDQTQRFLLSCGVRHSCPASRLRSLTKEPVAPSVRRRAAGTNAAKP